MNRLNIEELKHKSQTLQDIAADYLHLAQKAHSEVDTVRNARHAELLQLARQVELLSRIPVASQFSNPLAYYQAWQNWDEGFSKMRYGLWCRKVEAFRLSQGKCKRNMSAEKEKQQARLKRLAKKLMPRCEVHFNPRALPDSIEMRVDDSLTGKVLYASQGDWSVGQIKDKKDQELLQLLKIWRDSRSLS